MKQLKLPYALPETSIRKYIFNNPKLIIITSWRQSNERDYVINIETSDELANPNLKPYFLINYNRDIEDGGNIGHKGLLLTDGERCGVIDCKVEGPPLHLFKTWTEKNWLPPSIGNIKETICKFYKTEIEEEK